MFGLSPFYLIFGILGSRGWIQYLLQLTRVVSVWRALEIFGKFEQRFRKYSVFFNVLKAFCFLVVMWNFGACLWFFFNIYVQADSDDPLWLDWNDLRDASFARRYMFSMYLTMNIVATVGYGDMFTMTDVERLFVVFLINTGDALFAVAFGLIAALSMEASQNSEA